VGWDILLWPWIALFPEGHSDWPYPLMDGLDNQDWVVHQNMKGGPKKKILGLFFIYILINM